MKMFLANQKFDYSTKQLLEMQEILERLVEWVPPAGIAMLNSFEEPSREYIQRCLDSNVKEICVPAMLNKLNFLTVLEMLYKKSKVLPDGHRIHGSLKVSLLSISSTCFK